MKTVQITANDAEQRLDRFLRKVLLNVPLSHLYRGLRSGKVKLNGRRAHVDTVLKEGDRLDLYYQTGEITAQGGLDTRALRETRFFQDNFRILHEDKDLLCLNKPAGIAVHPGTKRKQGQTLIDLVQSYLKPGKDVSFRPALVHRLDLETSGVILVAKTGLALRELNRQIRERAMHKVYLALVAGRLPHEFGEFRESLIRVSDSERGGKVRIATESDRGESAVTRYRIRERLGDYTLVTVSIETGRTHQIRVHFASNHHPVAGDRDYGDAEVNRLLEKATGLRRQFLHASELGFHHPATDRPVSITAPLPQDLSHCLDILRGNASPQRQ